MFLAAHIIAGLVLVSAALVHVATRKRPVLWLALISGSVNLISGLGLLLVTPASLPATCARGLLLVVAAVVVGRLGRQLATQHA